mmetsp:Transcript_71459/g.168383  ORF Transcript_71459/g.168383 Transcript_71459/m.168383 type:complete len:156 (+) Transcript_71459:310-777(+)
MEVAADLHVGQSLVTVKTCTSRLVKGHTAIPKMIALTVPFLVAAGKWGSGVDMLEEVVAARRCLWLRSRTPLTESFLLLEVEAELEHALRLPEALADASRTLGNHSAAGRCATRSITFTERAVTVGGPTTTFGWATPEETWEEGEVAGTRTRISP